jgi:hypothetical protein
MISISNVETSPMAKDEWLGQKLHKRIATGMLDVEMGQITSFQNNVPPSHMAIRYSCFFRVFFLLSSGPLEQNPRYTPLV